MKWYKDLYVGESISHKVDKIKWKINHNAGTLSIYIIALASNPQNMLDIIPTRELLQKAYPKKEMRIIGLAGSYNEAIELVRKIVEETYNVTGNANVRYYLKNIRGGNKD